MGSRGKVVLHVHINVSRWRQFREGNIEIDHAVRPSPAENALMVHPHAAQTACQHRSVHDVRPAHLGILLAVRPGEGLGLLCMSNQACEEHP